MANNIVYIPIGNACNIASYLKHVGLRGIAYPFDWNVTPIKSAVKLINNDFEDFMELENLIFLEPTNRLLFKEDGINLEVTEDIITPVYCKKYNMLFVHDFSSKGKKEFELIKNKYIRRIERLRKILKSDKKIIFVYDNSPLNDWQSGLYKNVEYSFEFLSDNDLDKLNITRDKIEIISLDEVKKRTILLRIFASIKKKLFKST